MPTNFFFQQFVDYNQQSFAFTPQANFPITEGECDGMKSRLTFEIFSTLLVFVLGSGSFESFSWPWSGFSINNLT